MKSLPWVPGASSITDSNSNQPPYGFASSLSCFRIFHLISLNFPEFLNLITDSSSLAATPFGCISSMADLVFIYWVDIHEIKTLETPGQCVLGVLSNWVLPGLHSSKSDSLMISSYLDIPPISQSPCLIIFCQTCNQD